MANYEIVIRNETNKKKSPIAGDGSAPLDTSEQDSSAVRHGAVKLLAMTNHYIKPYVDQMITRRVSTVELRTGAQEHEERMSYRVQVGQRVYGFATSMITGALVGGPVGAVVGGLANLTTTAMEYANKYDKLNLRREVENIGLRYMNMRAGGSVASFSGSRLKNQ